MAIINTDFGLKRQGLCMFVMSQNLWDFASCKKKKQNKTQSFCLARDRKSAGFQNRTNHSRAVVTHSQKYQK